MTRRVALIATLCLVMTTFSVSVSAEERRHIQLGGSSSALPFSDGVLVGDTLYLSGKLGLEPGTRKPPEKVEDEVRLILDGLKKVLAEAEMTMNDLVSVDVFCSDPSLYGQFNEVYKEYFDGPFPARAFIGSGPLLFGARFEVRGIAVRSGG